MSTSAQIRAEIEATLAQRIPSALTPAPKAVRPTVATGIGAIDDLLGGGLPVGAISEIVGPECSGRTSLTLAFLAKLTRQGKVCAWVDVSDALHPESAAAAGVDLDRLLWVRCGGKVTTQRCEGVEVSQQSVDAPQTARVQFGGNSPHPRSESKGLPSAIGDLLGTANRHRREKMIGTPGATNRPLMAAAVGASQRLREEQVGSDRLPARRGTYVLEQREAYEPRCAEPQRNSRPEKKSFSAIGIPDGLKRSAATATGTSWSRLEQALRVTDLLLQAGGFSAIVLDMGSIGPEFASRVPLATWFRYRAAAERTQSSFLLLTQHACAKSSAGVLLQLDTATPQEAGATIFAGLKNHAELTRRRFEQEATKIVSIRKPVGRANIAEWRSRTVWAGQR